MKRVLTGCTALVALGITLATAAPAVAVDGNLPGGTSISVTINSPASGTILPPGPVTVTGSATLGTGVPVANTELIYVLDISASTFNAGTGCGGDQNGDGVANKVMDCEIAAAKALNDTAVALGTVGEVGVVGFASNAATADVSPAAGEQLVTGPATDDGVGGRDVEQVLASAVSTDGPGRIGLFTQKPLGTDTNFEDAIVKTAEVANASSKPNKLVVFLSDGKATEGGDITDNLQDARLNGVKILTFAVGSGSSCSDTGEDGQGSLNEIANSHGGDCLPVNTPELPDLLPGVIASQLTGLSLSVDGLPGTPITDISAPLPQNGPAAVNYSVVTPPLASGTHNLCVTAGGSDGGGTGSVTDCTTVIINAAPTVDAGGPYAGQEGTAVGIAGSVTDPDSAVTSEWTIAAGAGVDQGASCAFGDKTATLTTVTCTDDGAYTLTLTGNDGVNQPVSASTALTLTNVAPAVSISAPAGGTLFARGTPVAFTAPFTDIGTNDSHTCSVNFDDGSPLAAGTVSEVPGSGTCTITHAFTALGVHDVLVRITDDDGGSATAVVRVVIFLPGEAFGIQANGLITVAKTPHVTCPPNDAKTVASLNLLGLGSVNALNANCTVDTGTGKTTATASVSSVNLLAGAIRISTIESSCVADASGIVRSSRVGTINGIPIGIGSGSLGIPGVAQVFYNETATGPGGRLIQNAVRVRTLLGQEIILAGCRLG